MKDLLMFDKDPNIIEDQNDLGKDTTVFKINKDSHLIAKDQTYITEVYESNEQTSDSTVFKIKKDLSSIAKDSLDFKAKELSFILDTGAPNTLVGFDNFKKILASYPKIISQQIEYEKSSTRFVFGGGETTESVAKVKLPVYTQCTICDFRFAPFWGKKLSARIGDEFSTLNGSYDMFITYYQRKKCGKVWESMFFHLCLLSL